MSYGHDDLEDEDDLRDFPPLDPRRDLGYQHPTLERRSRAIKPAALFYTVVERERCEPEERGGSIGGELRCAPRDATLPGCGEPATVLHADPRSSHPARTICGVCCGKINRERIGWGSAGGGA